MGDESMDRRLREYAARWTAARPAPAAVAVPASRRSWVPAAAAAAVVALVAGVTYAVGRPPRITPVSPSPAPPASPSPSAGAPACGPEDVRTTTPGVLDLKRDGRGLAATLELVAVRRACTLAGPPRLRIAGDGMADLGVEYVFTGPATPRVVPLRDALRLELRWRAPYCHARTRALVLVVDLGAGAAFRLPLDPGRTPACGTTGGASRLEARWLPLAAELCPAAAYDVVSAELTVPGPRGQVLVTALLRNASDRLCYVDVKPGLALTAEDGTRVAVTNAQDDDARSSPPLPPGGTVRAKVWWSQYCGRPLGAYRMAVAFAGGEAVLPLRTHPFPECDPALEMTGDRAWTSSSWLEVVSRPARD